MTKQKLVKEFKMLESIVEILSKVLNILFLYNVTGTSFGVLLGLLLLSIQDVVSIYCPIFGLIRWYGFIVFGVIIFNLKIIFIKKYEDPVIEKKLKYIREVLKESNLTKTEERMLWRKAVEFILEETNNNVETNNIDNVDNSVTS